MTTKSAKYASQFYRTKENKLRKLKKLLEIDPNNSSVREALEFWQTHDRKKK